MKSTVALTPVSVPLHERKWMDVNPRDYDHKCHVVSKARTRLLRHDQTIPLETDGAVKFNVNDIVEEFKKKKTFDGALQWSVEDWISILAGGGGQKKRFQYCLNPNSSKHIRYFRAIQCHSGGIAFDPELQDSVLFLKGFTEHIHYVGNVSKKHSIIRSGLISGGRKVSNEEGNPCSSRK